MWRRLAPFAAAVFVFAFSWLFRFNDPNGGYAGLTDDHFFYLVRGWQILFGDLPVRDFVDHGAPLYYYVGAAVQLVGGRGTLSEVVFSVTVLSLSAVLVYWLAARASGSVLLGLAAALMHVMFLPRFYNYPKILTYALAIPALWAFADRPSRARVVPIALVTAMGFLYRHDHGVFVGLALVTLLGCLTDVPWRDRLRHAASYGVLVASLLAPWAAFVQWNGGLLSYAEQSAAWAARDRQRTPLVWPELLANAAPADATDGGLVEAAVGTVRANAIAWQFYFEFALPLVALGVLALSSNGLRRQWPRAREKIATVAVLGIILNAGFLRSPLGARLADPSVPHAILIAWLCAAAVALYMNGDGLRASLARYRQALAPTVALAVVGLVAVPAVLTTNDLYDRLDAASLTGPPRRAIERVGEMRDRLGDTWPLEAWASRETSSPMWLAYYLRDCTAPDDRVFLQPYLPQVPALARRAFAGGHADLRPEFHNTEAAQRLTIERLEGQSVPVVVLETGRSLENFRVSFPLLAAYFDRNYHSIGERTLDTQYAVHLLAANAAVVTGQHDLTGWPCFRPPPS